jgi:putative ABC transport system ATP-binding protein
MSALRIEALRFLDRGPIDLIIAPGECVAVSGPSGIGKTLLLRAIADLDASEGRVFLDGVERMSVAAPEWRRRVALLFAESMWWKDLVGDHFASIDSSLLERLGFPQEVGTWSVGRLSTGEKQRLALARLLSIRPAALLLDEPTANLDADNAARAEVLIEEYRRSKGAAVLWVTHDPRQGARVAERHLHFSSGRLVPVRHRSLWGMASVNETAVLTLHLLAADQSQHASPETPSRPSRTSHGTMSNAATGSAHHQPAAAFATSPRSSVKDK